MTYAILTPVYGIPLRRSSGGGNISEKMDTLLDEGNDGFMRYYSDCNESAIAFGVYAGEEIDQGCHHVESSSFVLQPTNEQVAKFNNLYEKLDEDIKQEMKAFGKPRVFYLMRSS